MRIMDVVLILFQKRIDPTQADPERPCPKPSWQESLKVLLLIQTQIHYHIHISLDDKRDIKVLLVYDYLMVYFDGRKQNDF